MSVLADENVDNFLKNTVSLCLSSGQAVCLPLLLFLSLCPLPWTLCWVINQRFGPLPASVCSHLCSFLFSRHVLSAIKCFILFSPFVSSSSVDIVSLSFAPSFCLFIQYCDHTSSVYSVYTPTAYLSVCLLLCCTDRKGL